MTRDENTSQKVTSTIARSNDGTIQITFTIPWEIIKKARRVAVTELGKDIEVPGFRKGKAPENKVQEQIPQNTLLEKTLSIILPKTFTDTIVKEKIKPAIYPKFEVLKAEEENDWQVRAVTAEIPEIELGDYRQLISQAVNSKKIWTPDTAKTRNEQKHEEESTTEEKEQKVIKLLLENIKLDIPKILIDEEVNSRLSRLLERIEKLGLTLEGYLSSINKNGQSLRSEYITQANQNLTLDLILSKISEEENIQIDESQVEATLKAAAADPKIKAEPTTPEQKRIIESILKRRKALEILTQLM